MISETKLILFGFLTISSVCLLTNGQNVSPDIVSMNKKLIEYLEKYRNREEIFRKRITEYKKLKNENRFLSTPSFLIDQILDSVIHCDYSQSMKHYTNLCQMERDVVFESKLNGDYWAFEIEDANGRENAGRFQLRNNFYGDFNQCHDVRAKNVLINGTKENWKGEFISLSYTGLSLTSLIFDSYTTAYCATPRCSTFLKKFKTFHLVNTLDCNENLTIGNVEVFPTRKIKPAKDDKHFIGGLVFFCFFGLLTAVGTALDYFLSSKDKEDGIPIKCLKAFSLVKNVPKILSTSVSKDSFTAIHGLRTITISWVVLGHTCMTIINSAANLSQTILTLTKDFRFQVIYNAPLSVDTFFTISGFLATYIFMKEFKKLKYKVSPQTVFMYYFHRYWRLTPMLASITVFTATIYPRISTGPSDYANVEGNDADVCRKNWWRSLLYVDNLISLPVCPATGWYLNVDMQLYVVLGISLFLFALSPYVTFTLLFGLFSSHIISAAVLLNDKVKKEGLTPNMDMVINIYFKPWSRSGPYAIGAFLGFFMLRYKKPRIPVIAAIFGWILAFGTGFTIVYIKWIEVGENTVNWSKQVALMYYVLYRPVWGLCICWVIWACHSGYDGIINQILSCPLFVPLSKISFGIYLYHWTPQLSFVRSQKYAREISIFNLSYEFMSHMTVSITLGFIACLMFDSPFIHLAKILFFRKRIQNKSKEEGVEEKDVNKIDIESNGINKNNSNNSINNNFYGSETKSNLSYIPCHLNEGYLKDNDASNL